MIDICNLKRYFEEDMVFITNHASERFRQRSIRTKDIREAVLSGEIIEQYSDDYPFPSCLILGYTYDKVPLHVVMSEEGTGSRIITAYFPNLKKWECDYRTRKEQS